MQLSDYKKVFFLGIGGIGMSALARWFLHFSKWEVAGYDRTPSELTRALEQEGVVVIYEDEINLLPSWDVADTLVVYTPAIPANNRIQAHLRQRGFQMEKRSKILGLITEGTHTLAVAGTHGKTTTSSMLTHLLVHAGRNVGAFVGGVMTNYNTNVILPRDSGAKPILIVEADEYDRSFLTLSPNRAVITAMDADHLDIYGDAKALVQSFHLFAERVNESGRLYIHEGVALQPGLKRSRIAYGRGKAQIRAENIRAEEGAFWFDWVHPEAEFRDLKLPLPGYHNVENAVAAIAMAFDEGLNEAEIRDGLSSYQGVRRRFERLHEADNWVYVDDYAHHPVELEALVNSLRTLYKGMPITLVFQPHLYSRTRDFGKEFGKALSLADRVYLLPIYAARENPIKGVSSDLIYSYMSLEDKHLVNVTELMAALGRLEEGVLVTAGAGDIELLRGPIVQFLKDRANVK
ncbi:MAG: UDP-N-acetylmuramate--L-alanine ligase [Cyclobacteriaceae bacterium]|nr:UDP-N-acetylmuramate--L-alanine ligase [Cyclobacteriaceae bacterium]MCH8516250.1 UDP-N-acetylmuramate--L-alanine ligase [Cyclobacteriaceae bacterium]